ncbi:hypothetical protein RA280_18945 [Cupriavidus sp. CV2]|uniref:hypothetical protein n=1 Tax=Cupriavidus ulmosensis TaxID=3065913 RepID=UPI00296B32BC|nr:hypothetical protein [Cupriavidus sp. CV2]MDW3683784.1 hypothetical protein [Cupriavidus sp. CV2]
MPAKRLTTNGTGTTARLELRLRGWQDLGALPAAAPVDSREPILPAIASRLRAIKPLLSGTCSSIRDVRAMRKARSAGPLPPRLRNTVSVSRASTMALFQLSCTGDRE